MRRCTVCDHKARMAIDLDLTGSETYRTIAGRYGLAETSLKRHSCQYAARDADAVRADGRGFHGAGRACPDAGDDRLERAVPG